MLKLRSKRRKTILKIYVNWDQIYRNNADGHGFLCLNLMNYWVWDWNFQKSGQSEATPCLGFCKGLDNDFFAERKLTIKSYGVEEQIKSISSKDENCHISSCCCNWICGQISRGERVKAEWTLCLRLNCMSNLW